MISKIVETSQFKKSFKYLPHSIEDAFFEVFELFLDDPHHPSLRLHPLERDLSGKMSFSITEDYRCIVRLGKDDTEVILFDIGNHDIYRR